jgi:DNA-binding transcriptional ArsR family regulator
MAPPIRELTDPKTMRALAHPTRLRLLEVLAHEGELTATEAGERIGESPASCSFHLRQLAKYGFVEEAPRTGGRRRPWRPKGIGMRFTDVHEDRETAQAAGALARVLRDRNLARAQRGLDARAYEPPEWRRVLGESEFTLYVTPEEFAALDAEVTEMLLRYQDRLANPALRPEGAQPVQVLLMGYRYRPGEA